MENISIIFLVSFFIDRKTSGRNICNHLKPSTLVSGGKLDTFCSTAEMRRTLGLTGNFCRNPNHLAKPWCFVSNSTPGWEYCNVRECTSEYECDFCHCMKYISTIFLSVT